MLTKNELKYYSSLLQKKTRKEEDTFIAEGKRLVEEGLKSDFKCEIVLYTNEFNSNYPEFIQSIQQPSELITESEFRKVSATKNPQGIAAVFKMKKSPALDDKKPLVIALEDISDPGNLGTILRSCEWFGAKEILVSETCAEIYNPKTLRASMGAAFYLDIIEPANFYDELSHLKKEKAFKIITADMNGENLYQFNFPDKSVIVFCGEANGPSDKLLSLSDEQITIPKFGSVESLNVANAASIILSQYRSKQ